MCLGYWTKIGFFSLEDMKAGASLPDVKVDDMWVDDEDWGIIVG